MTDACKCCDEYGDCSLANTGQAYMCGMGWAMIMYDKARTEKEEEK